MKSSIAIVGAGLVGVTLAIDLKQQGFDVVVYDKSSDIRNLDFKGRSINLALSSRGWRIFKKLGIEQYIKDIGTPMYDRAIHMEGLPTKLQPYSIKGDAIWALSRGDLNKRLIDIAENQGVKFKFETPIWDVDLKSGILYTAQNETQQWTGIKHDLIFGADGAYSKVRLRLQKQRLFEYQQSYLPLGYKELVIGANDSNLHVLAPNQFHIWPRKDFMLIALANKDGSFTCTLFMNYKGEVSFEKVNSTREIEVFFMTYFSDVMQLIPDLVQQYMQNPVNSLVTTKCYPWVFEDKVALIGDAAHAIVPFYGQGLNAGLEDVFVLSNIIANNKAKDFNIILSQYQEQRKVNADAIAELSYRNFEEMSAHTASDRFLLQKKIETKFSVAYPELWLPLYDRVTFSFESYMSALELGDFQQEIMQEIMAIPGIEQMWDSIEIEDKIKQLLKIHR